MKNKPSFLHQNRPFNTCMIQADNPERAIEQIRTAVFAGVDAFGFQMCRMKPEFRNEDTIKGIFSYMGGRPVYVTNYRAGYNDGKTDDELMDGLLFLVKCGATLVDIPGDTYCKTQFELTQDEAAVAKQKEIIKRFHAEGAEVLMSSHVFQYRTEAEVLCIAHAHEERGADIAKIVTAASNEDEGIDNLRITASLRRNLDIPFLFLSVGVLDQLHRMIGPSLGAVMWLSVPEYDALSTKVQPLCSAIHELSKILPC